MAEDKKSATLLGGTKVTGPAEVIERLTGKAKQDAPRQKPAAKSEK